MKHEWTEADFDKMSWHDNSVHGINIAEGDHGAGKLTLDLDYILDWVSENSGSFQFKVLPATLTFHETTDLRINIDYSKVSAALTPFAIDQIRFESVVRESGYVSKVWTIIINWPAGEITFESTGFSQIATGATVLSERQSLTKEQRANVGNSP